MTQYVHTYGTPSGNMCRRLQSLNVVTTFAPAPHIPVLTGHSRCTTLAVMVPWHSLQRRLSVAPPAAPPQLPSRCRHSRLRSVWCWPMVLPCLAALGAPAWMNCSRLSGISCAPPGAGAVSWPAARRAAERQQDVVARAGLDSTLVSRLNSRLTELYHRAPGLIVRSS